MDEDYTKSASSTNSRAPYRTNTRPAPSTTHTPPTPRGFFNRHHNYNNNHAHTHQPHMQQQPTPKLDQNALILISLTNAVRELTAEIKMKNTLELIRMKQKDDEMQKEIEVAKQIAAEDAKRFEQIQPSLYN